MGASHKMALKFGDGIQESVDGPLSKIDWGSLLKLIDKVPKFSNEEVSPEEELDEPIVEEKNTSIMQDIGGVLGDVWGNITDRGATVQDYFPEYNRDEPAVDRFGAWRRKPSGELPEYLQNPDYSTLMLKAWNNDSSRQPGSLTSAFNSKKWSN